MRSLICLMLCFGIGSVGLTAEPVKKSKTGKSKVTSTPVAPTVPAATASPYGDSYSPPDTPTYISPTAVTSASKLPEPVNSPPVDLKPVPLTGQKKWEAILAQPSELDFGERQTVTVKELLDQLRERHQLSLRFDIPTLSALLGKENVISETKEPTKTASLIAKRNTAIRVISRNPSKKGKLIIISEPEQSAKAYSDYQETSEDSEDDDTDADSKMKEETGDEACDDECDNDDADHEDKVKSDDDDEKPQTNIVEEFLSLEINIQTMCLKQANVSTVLRQLLDAMPIVFGNDVMEMPFPISLTNACLLDYLVEKDGLLITTRMQALSHKETRVYSVKHLSNLNPEQLAKIVRQSIRPWSWRSQINDLGDQLRGNGHIPSEMVKSIVTTGVQLAAAQSGATVTISDNVTISNGDESPSSSEKSKKSEAEEVDALGNATVNGLVTLAHATVLSLEMVHHADFPTGTIFTLPGKLIVTQSQATHREIADLLNQLSVD
ncbi:MAG: hypothetical protein WCH39_14285 [Schlesneria sp.]